MATPPSPISKPSQPRQASRSPCGHIASNTAIHKGAVAANTAAAPDGTVFSAKVSSPLPATNIKTPVTNANKASRRERRMVLPLKRRKANTSRPARQTREPAKRAGGSVLTPSWMARYVVPQET